MTYRALLELIKHTIADYPGFEAEWTKGNGLWNDCGRNGEDGEPDGEELWVAVRSSSCVRMTVISLPRFFGEVHGATEEEASGKLLSILPDLVPREVRVKQKALTAEECLEQLDEKEQKLFRMLADLRKTFAARDHIPAYRVFTNRALLEMAKEMPETMAELGGIRGVGPNNSVKYGHAFIGAINAFFDEVGRY